MTRATIDKVRPAKVLGMLSAVSLVIAGVYYIVLVPAGGSFYSTIVFFALALGVSLLWAAVVWLPLWKQMVRWEVSGVPRIVAMSLAGVLLSVPVGIIEYIADQSVLVAFFAGVFGTAAGFIGSTFLVLIPSQRAQ